MTATVATTAMATTPSFESTCCCSWPLGLPCLAFTTMEWKEASKSDYREDFYRGDGLWGRSMDTISMDATRYASDVQVKQSWLASSSHG
jgi:hypothetical protein